MPLTQSPPRPRLLLHPMSTSLFHLVIRQTRGQNRSVTAPGYTSPACPVPASARRVFMQGLAEQLR